MRRAVVGLGTLVAAAALAAGLVAVTTGGHPTRGHGGRPSASRHSTPPVHVTLLPVYRFTTGTGPEASVVPASGAGGTGGVRSRVIPEVVGLSLSAAERAVASAGLRSVTVVAQVATTSRAPETVVVQTGTRLSVAVPPARACTSTQLAATYEFNQGGMGNAFASLVVRNVSATWCTIGAPITARGVAATGQRVSGPAGAGSLSDPAVDELSPKTPPVPAATTSLVGTGIGYPLGTFFGWIGIWGPSNSCTPEIPGTSVNHVVPAAWHVTLASGATASAENGTLALATMLGAQVPRTARPFSSCGGVLHVEGATVRFGNAGRLPSPNWN